jgi:hypothetical protein
VIQIQDLLGEPGGAETVSRITLRNNVLHDSYNNDILKINNGASHVEIEGNLFYNQTGSDEHIDVNSVTNVTIQDNTFFNDFAGSGRENNNDTSSYIVIKDSNGSDDTNLGSRNITVQRNVFLNWEGSSGSYFVLVENNLMLGNSPNVMRAAFGVKGGRNITFRNNTVVGDLPALAYAMRLNSEGDNPPNEEIHFYNNVWSDPNGTMGAEDPTRPDDYSDTPPAETQSFILDTNLYWNGGAPIPSDPAELVNYTDDPHALIADPLLPDQADIQLPHWQPAGGLFADGSTSIRQAFERLVDLYGKPAVGSPVVDSGNQDNAPLDDILGNPRTAGMGVDHGAYERQEYGFNLHPEPAFQAIWPGESASFNIGVQAQGGFTGTVDLEYSSLPVGIIADLTPVSMPAGAAATLILTDTHSAHTLPGLDVHVFITGTSGNLVETASVSLLVGGVRLYTPLIFNND